MGKPGAAGARPLIVVAGNLGTGKSTVGELLRRGLDFEHVDADLVRHQIATVYRLEDGPRLMARMDEIAGAHLQDGKGVIMDRLHTTFGSRMQSYQLAASYRRPVLLIECIAPEGVAKARLALRAGQTHHLPPNDTQTLHRSYDRIKRIWEEIGRDYEFEPRLAGTVSHLRYDSSTGRVEQLHVAPGTEEFIAQVRSLLEGVKPEEA